MTIIAQQLSKLSRKDARPPSQIKYTGKQMWNGDFDGKTMKAKVSINPGGSSGSVPQEESKLWNAVSARKGSYVRGHLLNHQLHGPGEKKI